MSLQLHGQDLPGGTGPEVLAVADGPANQNLPSTVLRTRFFRAPFDLVEARAVLPLIAERTAASRFGYVVTPNVDHVVRLRNGDATLAEAYDAAWVSICDSRPIVMLARLLGRRLPHLPGSDLTEQLFRDVVRPGDRIALIAANDELAHAVAAAYPHLDIDWMVPPPRTLSDPGAMRACTDFVARSNARFIFIGIGSPVSERIALGVARQGDAKGTAFCIGASLEFLVGRKRRAPHWMRRLSIEWLHRLLSEPRRLWRRYATGVLPLAGLFVGEIAERGRSGNRIQSREIRP